MARTKEHRCGECAWQGTGSTDCPNYEPRRASQPVPEVDDALVFEKSPYGKWWSVPVRDT